MRNVFKENLQSMKKRHHVAKVQIDVQFLSLKQATWSQRRDNQASEKGLQLIRVITPPVLNHLS